MTARNRVDGMLRRSGIAVLAVFLALRTAQAADKAQTTTGTVSRVQSSARTLVVALTDGGETTFVWSAETRFSGVLTPGAKVTVRYVTGADGKNLALQITVARS